MKITGCGCALITTSPDKLLDRIAKVEEDYGSVIELSQKAVEVLGVSGVSRADIRFDDTKPLLVYDLLLELLDFPYVFAYV